MQKTTKENNIDSKKEWIETKKQKKKEIYLKGISSDVPRK